jgi:outer membrane autotransporter protein
VTSASAYIGVSSNDVDNTVLVGDTGSEWNLSGDLAVNAGNTLEMATNGLVTVAGSMSVSNAAVDGTGTVRFSDDANTFSISGEQSRISTNILFEAGGGDDLLNISDFELAVSGSFADRFVGFETLAMTNSRLSGSGTVDVFDTLSLSGSALAPSGELLIDGALSVSDSRLQLTAGYGILSVTNSGALDLTGLAADISVSNNAAPAGFNELVLRSADGFTAGGFATTNFNEHYLLYDFRLTNDTTAVTAVSTAARDGEISSTLAYSGIQGVRAGFDGMQNTLFTRTRQLRRNAVATDYAISNEAYLLSDTNAPSGPPGPGDRNTIFGMHFWAEQFSGQGDYDRMGISDGYVLNNNGTTFGFDRLLGDSFALGLNYTYARSAARSDGGDQMDTETYWLALYGEWFSTEGYYLDGLLGYGWSDYNSLRVEEGYRGIGTTEGTGLGGHLEAGKYFHRGNWALAPYAGLHYLGIESDDYTEAERDSGLEVEVEGQNAASLESALGVKARSRFDTAAGRFQAVGYTEWAYDFVNDDIETTLSGDGVTVSTARITPDEQTLNAGLGLSWICTEYLEVGVGYDGRFGKSYEEHTGSAMLEVRF